MRLLYQIAARQTNRLLASLVGDVSDPVALVFRDLSSGHGWVRIDSQVTVFINSTHGLVPGLNDVLQVGILGQAELLASIHSA